MNQGQYNAAALTALANGGKEGAWAYIKNSVPEDYREMAISTVKTTIAAQERRIELNRRRKENKLRFGKDHQKIGGRA